MRFKVLFKFLKYDFRKLLTRIKLHIAAWHMEYKELSLFTLSLFFAAFVLFTLQFVWVAATATLLYFFHIPFTWHPLLITEVSENWRYWTESRVFLIYVVVPLIMLFLGLLLFRSINHRKSLTYRERLFYGWITFFLINSFIGGLFAGVFVFDGMGVLLAYMFPQLWMRVLILVIPLFLFYATAMHWNKLFIKATPSLEWTKSHSQRFRLLQINYIFPLMALASLLVLYGFWLNRWYLSLTVFSILFILLPVKPLVLNHVKVRVNLSYNKFPQFVTVFILLALLILLIVSSHWISLRLG